MSRRLLLRLLALLSLGFNVAFAIHLLTPRSGPAARAVCAAELQPETRQRMMRLRQELEPQYGQLQRRLEKAQAGLLQALRGEAVNRPRIDACLHDIAAIQAEWQRLTVEEILQCKRFMSRHDCRCLLDRMGSAMGVPGESRSASCPAAEAGGSPLPSTKQRD